MATHAISHPTPRLRRTARCALLSAVCLVAVDAWGAMSGGAAPARADARCGRSSEASGFDVPARPGVVPDMRCMDLQLAQDKAQAAEFGSIESHDASGKDRAQLSDRNWVVVRQDPPSGKRAGSSTTITLWALRYGDPGAPGAPDRGAPERIPRLDCFDLQEARDTLQSAGFVRIDSEDASGYGRRRVAERNWTVVDQEPSPGTTAAKDRRIVLGAVKDDETESCR